MRTFGVHGELHRVGFGPARMDIARTPATEEHAEEAEGEYKAKTSPVFRKAIAGLPALSPNHAYSLPTLKDFL